MLTEPGADRARYPGATDRALLSLRSRPGAADPALLPTRRR